MRPVIVIGNWKMYKTIEETLLFIKEVVPLIQESKAEVFLAVPFTALSAAAKAAQKTKIVIGAQNMNEAREGAFTGEIAGVMIEEAGGEFVLLGHSERRQIFKESDETINHKVIRALKDDLRPVLCIGETLSEREKKETQAVLERQLTKGLEGASLEETGNLIIAYEPVWAIGTGKAATPKMVEEAHLLIRNLLVKLFGKTKAQEIPILYGGSVKPENVQELIRQKDVDGVLVGGASLTPKSFSEIVNSYR